MPGWSRAGSAPLLDQMKEVDPHVKGLTALPSTGKMRKRSQQHCRVDEPPLLSPLFQSRGTR